MRRSQGSRPGSKQAYKRGMTQAAILGLRNRLDRIEDQLRTISTHLGIPYDDGGSAIPPEVVELVQANKRLQAMQKYVELTGADLGTAQDVVAGLSPRAGRGCNPQWRHHVQLS